MSDLTPRQGKVLRYVVSTRTQPVAPSSCIAEIEWSDLPKTDMQARKALDVLRKHGLIERVGKNAYVPTDAGREALALANKEGLWRQAPPPSKTNRFLHRKDQ